jgi:hypothetical protein
MVLKKILLRFFGTLGKGPEKQKNQNQQKQGKKMKAAASNVRQRK